MSTYGKGTVQLLWQLCLATVCCQPHLYQLIGTSDTYSSFSGTQLQQEAEQLWMSNHCLTSQCSLCNGPICGCRVDRAAAQLKFCWNETVFGEILLTYWKLTERYKTWLDIWDWLAVYWTLNSYLSHHQLQFLASCCYFLQMCQSPVQPHTTPCLGDINKVMGSKHMWWLWQ